MQKMGLSIGIKYLLESRLGRNGTTIQVLHQNTLIFDGAK